MKAEKIAEWATAVGPAKAARRVGISLATLGRYTSGQTSPRGSALILIERAVGAWDRARAKAESENN